MGIILQDTFTDTDGTVLQAHTRNDGGAWTKFTGPDATIQSNRCRANGSTTQYKAASTVSDFTLTCICRLPSGVGGGFDNGIFARLTDQNNAWLISVRGYASFRIFEVNAGNFVTRATDTGLSLSADTDYTLTVTAAGATITATIDGHSINYGSATFNQTVTNFGIYAESSGVIYDDYLVTVQSGGLLMARRRAMLCF